MSHSQARRYSSRARGDGGRAETCEGSHGSVGAVAGGDGEHCSKLRSKTAAEPCSLTQRKQPQHRQQTSCDYATCTPHGSLPTGASACEHDAELCGLYSFREFSANTWQASHTRVHRCLSRSAPPAIRRLAFSRQSLSADSSPLNPAESTSRQSPGSSDQRTSITEKSRSAIARIF